MLNLGYIQVEASDGVGGAVTCRIYYDTEAAAPQPLIDGPRGYCLDVVNTTGRTCDCSVTAPDGQTLTLVVGQGDPVNDQSRTANQMKALGFSSREDASGLTVSINE